MGPQEYELPHDEWRPEQKETVWWLMGATKGETSILEAPTGSGKTALARAIASRETVTALCRTKVLQQENYDEAYGFDALFGRGNYPCALNPELTGAECEYAEIGMHECPEVDRCAYLQQKNVVMSSGLRSLNYAYWLTAHWPRLAGTKYVFCDEAHLLSDTILDFTGTTIMDKQRMDWGLPNFPRISSHSGSMLIQSQPTSDALLWLEEARSILLATYYNLEKYKGTDRAILKKIRRCERLGLKVKATIEALKTSASDWYILSGPNARSIMGRPAPGFVCRPLTARHHAPNFFQDGWNTVMMSATIGDREAFAKELGISRWRERGVPGAWPPESRPVWVPKNAPKMGQAAKKKGPGAYDRQAEIIADLIKSVPPTWCGVIHHTSIKEAKTLAARLSNAGLSNRIWLPPEKVGTETQMAAWNEYKIRTPNALAIAWSWQTGVDLLDEKICIVSKVQFPYLGDKYERARLEYDGKFYLQRTAWNLEQSCGRTRRGRPEDYDTPEERRGLVAIVDGNWTRVKKYLSQPFLDAITEF